MAHMVCDKPQVTDVAGTVKSTAAIHPLGTKARVLLTSVFGPYACDDEYGSRTGNPMELYHGQVTRLQGPFSMRMFTRNWGLMMIQANISAPCTLLDFPSQDRFVKEISENHYDIVGIGSVLVNFVKVRAMCELIRKYQPGATIVIGGHIASLPGLAERIDADHIVRGEGISWFRAFLGEDVNQPVRHIVDRCTFWRRIMGSMVPDESNPAVLIPSVGCPMGCNFCSTSAMFGGKGRCIEFIKSGDELFETMCGIEKALGVVREFFVMDENFLLRRDRAMRLLELMEEHEKTWGLSVFSSANVVKRYTMDELARMGVIRLWLGLEGKNSQYGKLSGVDTLSLVRDLQAHGISVLGSTIIGLEEHTPENLPEAIEYAVSHDADFQQFMLYTPLPGTPLHVQLEAEGKLLPPEAVPFADRYGQQRFSHLHPHIRDGQEKYFLDRAFLRDYEVNGPGLLRVIRTNLAGWKRYGRDSRPRIRARWARIGKTLPTLQAGAIWAGRRYCAGNPVAVKKLSAVLDGIYAEFGIRARLAASFYGRVILGKLRREATFLAQGGTYEPETFCEMTGEPVAGELRLASTLRNGTTVPSIPCGVMVGAAVGGE